MNIAELLTFKYPNANFMVGGDIIVQDDGQGPYIKEWNLSDPKPTQADLDQWAIDLAPAYQFMQNKIANAPIYDQLDTLDIKSIRALREGDTQRITDLETQAAALRAQLLPVS